MRDIFHILIILMLIMTGCFCGGNGSGVSGDVGMDESNSCGVGRYPSFDYQCAGNIGCREINMDRCGCRCTRCDSDKCVEMSCDGECVRDVGVDVNDVLDYEDISDEDIRTDIEEVVEDAGVEEVIDVGIRDAEDGGSKDEIEYECEDLGDPVGVEFGGNLDEPIVYIAEVYMDGWITGDYVVWMEPSDMYMARDIYYLNIKDRRVRRVPNCDRYEYIEQLIFYKNKIYWSNTGKVCVNNRPCAVIWEFDLDIRSTPRIVSRRDEAFSPKVYEDNLVYGLIMRDGDPKNGTYYYNLKTGEDRKISNDALLLSAYYYYALYKNLIVGVSDRIFTINIDTLEEKTYYVSKSGLAASPVGDPLPRFLGLEYVDKEVYEHYTNDIFMMNIDTGEFTKVTNDEAFQFSPVLSGELVLYHENDDPKESQRGYGHLIAYDLKTKVKRKVKEIDGTISCRSFNGKYLLYTPDRATGSERYYLVDLEKLGVIKDGHVVPE